MKIPRLGVLILMVGLTAAAQTVAQRGPEPQEGTGQNNPDMERGTAPGKSDQSNGSGTAAPQTPGQESPDTQQTKPSTKKGKNKNHKEHGGSHDQASPQM